MGRGRKNKGRARNKIKDHSENPHRVPNWMLTGATALYDPHENREFTNKGTYGPASEVRIIDPKDYKPDR